MNQMSKAAGPVTITYVGESTRWSLRLNPEQLAEASTAFGLEIPAKIGGRTATETKEAICLGPDEWVLTAPATESDAITAAFKGIYDTVPHALVEIGNRDVSVLLEGARVIELLEAAAPRDLSKVSVGEARRTLFDTATVIYVRLDQDKVRLDVWRSFMPHVLHLLNRVNEEMAIGL